MGGGSKSSRATRETAGNGRVSAKSAILSGVAPILPRHVIGVEIKGECVRVDNNGAPLEDEAEPEKEAEAKVGGEAEAEVER